jgi:serine phosphatase RsbU (regulator of sigma subunit)
MFRHTLSRSLLVLLIAQALYCPAQNRKADSLLLVLRKTNADTSKLKTLLALSFELRAVQPDNAQKYATEALHIAHKTGDRTKQGKALNNIGLSFFYRSDYDKAIVYYDSSLTLALENADFPAISLAYSQIGNAYKGKNNIPLSIEYHTKALNIRLESTDTTSIAQSYLNLGNAYVKNTQYELALSKFLKGLELFKHRPNSPEVGGILNGIGNVYLYQKNYGQALDYYLKGYRQSLRTGDQRGISTFSMNVGNCFLNLKNADSAYYYLSQSVELTERTKNKSALGEAYASMGGFYEQTEHYDKAIEFSKKATDVYRELGLMGLLSQSHLNLAQQFLKSGNKKYGEKYLLSGLAMVDSINEKQEIFIVYEKIASCYNLLGDNASAYQYMKKALAVKDSIYITNNTEAIAQMQSTFDFKTKENEIELLNKENQLRDYRINRQQTIIFSLIGSALLFVLLVFLIYIGYKRTKAANHALSMANKEINEKNKNISDSIQYAKNIQNALLKLPSSFEKLMRQNYFILYKPKDVVSGDFYWIEEYKGLVLVAAADCTGHGVPGSLMSMLGIEKLKQAVREKGLTDPGEILAFANRSFKETLSNTENENTVRDGMDIGLCCIAPDVDTIKYAGANRPLWVLEKNGDERTLKEVSPTKAAIGGFTDESQVFQQHEVLVKDGNIVYLFTDGFADQFGGELNKKFNMKRFRELIPKIGHLPMQEQKKALEKAFEEWKGSNEQVDDVLVIGMKNGN